MEDYRFPTNLKNWKYRIERLARRKGLRMCPVIYIVVNDQEMAELGARHGFPVTEHHWRYGQESLTAKKESRYGMNRMYEMVINTSPSYAYLLQRNEEIHQKSVMAHVCGHVDFFQNNAYFDPTNRDMLNAWAADAVLLQSHMDAIGYGRVKEFQDWVLSFEWCVDPNRQYQRQNAPQTTAEERTRELQERLIPKRIEPKTDLADYMDQFLNPSEWLTEERERLTEEVQHEIDIDKGTHIPPTPQRDLLQFLIDYAPLEYWQRDIIAMVRRHSYYLVPQWRTKIMNEGWASLWQEDILTDADMMDGGEVVEHSKMLAGVLRKRGGKNPYRLGLDLWLDIQERWDTGRHGDIWEMCPSMDIREHWELFAIFKSIWDETGGQEVATEHRWREVSAFTQALKAGKFGVPAEFFIRNMRTREEILPAWHLYCTAAAELARRRQMLERMEPLELQTTLLYHDLLATKPDTMPDDEMQWKARCQIYEEAGEDDLWLSTKSEMLADIEELERLVAFNASWQDEPIAHNPVPIPAQWYAWAAQNPTPIGLMQGTAKIFEVRATHDDLMFLQEFFTADFCERHKYFLYRPRAVWGDPRRHYILESRSFRRIKRRLLATTAHARQPVIRVKEANFGTEHGLHLVHEHNGIDLDWWTKDERYMKDVLQRLFYLWGGKRDVYLETILTKPVKERNPWDDWHGNRREDTDELAMREGELVVFHYGLRREDSELVQLTDYDPETGDPIQRYEEFYERIELDDVTYRAPW